MKEDKYFTAKTQYHARHRQHRTYYANGSDAFNAGRTSNLIVGRETPDAAFIEADHTPHDIHMLERYLKEHYGVKDELIFNHILKYSREICDDDGTNEDAFASLLNFYNWKPERKIWIVEVNEDGCEGRGAQIPLYYCVKEATAIRLSKGKDVQGTDGKVYEFQSPCIDGKVYAPIKLTSPSNADIIVEEKMTEEREAARKVDTLLSKMKDSGFTEEEINLLRK